MKAAEATLQNILYSPNRYVIPIFQRYYSWGKTNWDQLWEDLMELQDVNQKKQRHFMGSLVFTPDAPVPGKAPTFQVIDGQQRLITLSLLLCALRSIAASHGFNALSEQIMNFYLVDPSIKGQEYYRIYPRQRDRAQYLSAINPGIVTDDSIGQAYSFFLAKLPALPGMDTEAGITDFFTLIRSRLEFVQIFLEGENRYQIFKSLNSTGVDLTEADLIRNFVFMHFEASDQDDFDKQHWAPLEKHFENSTGGQKGKLDGREFSGFLRDFLMRDGKYIGKLDTFEQFEARNQHSFDPIKVATELDYYVEFYDILRGSQPVSAKFVGIEVPLNQLRQLDSSTTYPLLLKLMDKVYQGEMLPHELSQCLRLLSGFILRRYACELTSQSYGKWFVTACSDVDKQPLSDLRSFLKAKFYPDDDYFKEHFVKFNVYKGNYTQAILRGLEQAHPYKERADLSVIQTEHIMPQKLTDQWKKDLGADYERIHSKWLDTIGNLTITKYNSELSNKAYAEKRRNYYKNSGFILTKEISEQINWGEAEMEARGQRLAELACKVWIGPDA